jgi:hypothetical protein
LEDLHRDIFFHPLEAQHHFLMTFGPIFPLFLNHLLKFKDLFAETVDHKTDGLLLCYFIGLHLGLQIDYLRTNVFLGFLPPALKVVPQDRHGLCLDGFVLFID